jgi:toxin ParE1/3/4
MRLVFRPEAEADLTDIHDHIAGDSPVRAKRFVTLLRERCGALRQHPRMGRARDELRPGLRSLPVERYLVIYRVLEDAVEVVAVVHGSRDIEALFPGRQEEAR